MNRPSQIRPLSDRRAHQQAAGAAALRDDLALALGKINDWIVRNPGPAGMQAYGFVRALSREGLSEKTGDEECC